MSNGHAAIKMLTLVELPSSPAPVPDKSGIDLETGQAVADAVCVIRGAVEHCLQTGAFNLDPETRCEGGTMIARVAMLQLDHELGDDDFIDKAREAGRRVLRQRFAATDVQLIDVWIDDLFTIVRPIIKDERVFRIAWAN